MSSDLPDPSGPPAVRGNIVLIGPMAAGKSVLARALSARLGRASVDVDAVIAHRHGPVAEYFRVHGEESFRRLEAETVAEVLADPAHEGAIVALGGGAPMAASTQAVLADHTVVCLSIDAETVRPRILADASRPMLRRDPLARWAELLELRRETYAALADVVLVAGSEGTAREAEELVEELCERLGLAAGPAPATPAERTS